MSRQFKGWDKYASRKEAEEAERTAVAFVNEGLYPEKDMPPLSKGDLEDSKASYEWLKKNPYNEAYVVEKATLPHTGRPRVVSRNGLMAGEAMYQGDRFSSSAPKDLKAYLKDPEGYRKNGAWAVYPTVYRDPDGVSRLHTGNDAEAHYRRTNEHFGVYRGLKASDFGAVWDHHRGNAEWYERTLKRQDDLGGDTKGDTDGTASQEMVPQPDTEIPDSGPRIVINPTTFHNKKDALCVAFNEAFRVVMEMNSFEPKAEPTEAQRKFFSDTAYADDELMLRRTILARICTFDTSVTDPTDDQLAEAVEFLNTVLEIGAPQNEWEQSCVTRIRDIIKSTLEKSR